VTKTIYQATSIHQGKNLKDDEKKSAINHSPKGCDSPQCGTNGSPAEEEEKEEEL
jgi:hypothetical protein